MKSSARPPEGAGAGAGAATPATDSSGSRPGVARLLGQGVAIPHGRIKGLKEAVGAFVRLAQPVPFDAPDGKPVSLVFLLLVPEQATEQHLRVLSELAQMLSDRELREKLSTGTDAGTLHQHITAWQPHVADQRRAAV